MVDRWDLESTMVLRTQHNELIYLTIPYLLREEVGRCPDLTVHGRGTRMPLQQLSGCSNMAIDLQCTRVEHGGRAHA